MRWLTAPYRWVRTKVTAWRFRRFIERTFGIPYEEWLEELASLIALGDES